MWKRPVEAECTTCGAKVIDTHGELPGTRGGGERWEHSDVDAWAAGDQHRAVVGKVTEWAEFWDQADYDAEKKRKRQEEDA